MSSRNSGRCAQADNPQTPAWQRNQITIGIFLLVAALIAALAGCRSSWPSDRSFAEDRVWAVAAIVLEDRQREPGLQGFKDLDTLESTAFGRRSRPDADLLSARLYGESLQDAAAGSGANSGKRDPAGADEAIREKIHGVLAAGLPMEPVSRRYYDDLISDTRQRSAKDPAFQQQVKSWSRRLNRGIDPSARCYVDGLESTTAHCNSLIMLQFVRAIYCKPNGCGAA